MDESKRRDGLKVNDNIALVTAFVISLRTKLYKERKWRGQPRLSSKDSKTHV